MLDKNLIKENFKKSLKTYEDNAFIQKKMAIKLAGLIKRNDFCSILEIGSYTGLLTKEINKKFNFKKYVAIDIVNSFSFIEKINSDIEFINEDIENYTTDEKFDLIVANASLQWCDDFKNIVKKLLSFAKTNSTIAISTFSSNNLIEIKESFGISLNYPSIEELKNIFPNNTKFFLEEEKIKFDSSIEILKHLKATGVNSIKKNNSTYKEIKQKLKILNDKFNNTLTYSPIYIIYNNDITI